MPRYSTLSYCWGGLEFLKTRKDNLDALLINIPVNHLPRTFRDAIETTRALAVDYIWIDSLCIIQDDVLDWREELSHMCEVYGGSYINIAAYSAINPDQGAFTKPDHFVDAFQTLVSISEQRYAYDFHHPWRSYHHAVEDSHLSTRAWTLQEKLLPVRTIYIGDRGAVWECRTGAKMESLPHRTEQVSRWGMPTLTFSYPGEDRKPWNTAWASIMRAYSSAYLTMSCDKLPALSGIARHFSNVTQCGYLAGMWQDGTFVAQLCWRVWDPRPRPEWRAPSWSWVSVDGHAVEGHNYMTNRFYRDALQLSQVACVSVLEASVTLLGEDEFGEVKGGLLRIACTWVLRGKATMVKNLPTLGLWLGGNLCYPFSSHRENPNHCLFSADFDCTDDIETLAVGDVYLLPMAARSTKPIDTNDAMKPLAEHEDEHVMGLILRQAALTTGTFQRIGFFQCKSRISEAYGEHKQNELGRLWDLFIQTLAEQGAATAEQVCSETIDNQQRSTTKYVVTIV